MIFTMIKPLWSQYERKVGLHFPDHEMKNETETWNLKLRADKLVEDWI